MFLQQEEPMAKQRSTITEFQKYELPLRLPVLLLNMIPVTSDSRMHFHNCLEIGICHSGSGHLVFLEKTFPFQAGDITVTPKNIPHVIRCASEQDNCWSFLYLDPQELFWELLPAAWKNFELSPQFLPIFNREHYDKIYYLVTEILCELREQKPNYALSIKGLLLSLYIELIRTETEATGENQTGGGAADKAASEMTGPLTIMPALNFIEQNYMQQFTIEQLADLCHWSPTHFRRMFHSIMGVSPLEFVNATRIFKARLLLYSTEDSILNISETVGFHSVSSFNRAFLKAMQISPREYRKQVRTNNPF